MMILLGSKAIVWILLIRTNALRAPETLKRKLFEDVDVLSTNRNGGFPGHFTSQHVEGAANLCAEPRPMAKTFFARGAFRSENSNNLSRPFALYR